VEALRNPGYPTVKGANLLGTFTMFLVRAALAMKAFSGAHTAHGLLADVGDVGDVGDHDVPNLPAFRVASSAVRQRLPLIHEPPEEHVSATLGRPRSIAR
jgi:hypothetical protein